MARERGDQQRRLEMRTNIIFMRTKICTKCGLEKPTSEFNKNKLKKDGLQSECRDCHK
nr:MAG TPA: Meiotic chromosome segregation protein [Caudoviricetes sp.]